MIPLHQWLGRQAGADSFVLSCAAPAIECPPSPDPAQELARQLAEARRAGQAAAEAEAQAAMAAQAAAAEEEFQLRLAAARDAWTRDQGEAIARQVALAFAALEGEIAAAVADVLRPFLTDRVRQRALTELASLLATYTSACGPATVHIKAPEDLVAQLRAALAEVAPSVTFAAWPNCEVEATVDGTVLRSDIAGWCAAIEVDRG